MTFEDLRTATPAERDALFAAYDEALRELRELHAHDADLVTPEDMAAAKRATAPKRGRRRA